ncbi:hypothetical protein NESM_000308800 [Novymonas esmeraldas]|uniref:Sister chromatid cohesion protein n=1 Tax=Novymonas esmeraldas TaxID=1808958 RepID=A0AAW0EM30_9TRYP
MPSVSKATAATTVRAQTATTKTATSSASVTLSIEELRATPDSRLLTYLMHVHDAVRGLTLADVPRTAAVRSVGDDHFSSSSSDCFPAAYVEELLTPRLLSSPIPDVSQMVGCLLCDAIRLHCEGQQQQRQRRRLGGPDGHRALAVSSSESSGSLTDTPDSDAVDATGAGALPFSPARCAEVLQSICGCFGGVHSLQRVAYLVERAAAAHVFCHLLPHCDVTAEETQQALQRVFEAVRCATAAAAGEVRKDAGGGATAATSAATCREMAQLLQDVLSSTHVITPAQLLPLLEELVAASPALRYMGLSTSTSSSAAAAARPSHSRPSRHLEASRIDRSGGAVVAARVLLGGAEVMQPAITVWAVAEFEGGLAEILPSDLLPSDDDEDDADGDADGDGDAARAQRHSRPSKGSHDALVARRRRGLQVMSRVLEVLVALTELHVDLAEQLLPALAQHLEHTRTEVRLLLLRGFCAAFAANEAAVAQYRSIFTGPVLQRCMDVSPSIRTDAARLSAVLMRRSNELARSAANHGDSQRSQPPAAEGIGAPPPSALQRELWSAFQPCWERLLTDPHVLVRKQAVASVAEAALAAAPLLLLLPPRDVACAAAAAAADDDVVEQQSPASLFLARTLGLRALDRNRRVRGAAVEGLTRLYAEYRLAWIPNTVLDATRVDAGTPGTAPAALTAAVVVQGLLPAPAHSSASSPSPTATGGGGGGASTAAAAQTTLTRWMPASRSPAMFDFERADDDDGGHAQPLMSATPSHSVKGEFAEGDALLGLDAPSAVWAAPFLRGGASSSASAYVEALVRLCRHVDAAHYTQLLRLAAKQPQLRLAVRRLFELHAAVRASSGDVRSTEGQQRIHAVHRLLAFLQETTGAGKGEWESLFRAKDDTVRRALLHACQATHTNWREVRDGLLRALHGRVGAGEFAFVKETLVPQLLTPTQSAHVDELLGLLRGSIHRSARGEVVVHGAGAAGALRALLLLTAASPSYSALVTDGLIDAVEAATRQAVGPPPSWCALLLQCLQQWAAAVATATTADSPAAAAAAARDTSAPRSGVLVDALRAMALAALPMQQSIPAPATPDAAIHGGGGGGSGAALAALKLVAKQATRTLVALQYVPGYNAKAVAAVQSLCTELVKRLGGGHALTNDVKTIAWLASLRAVARAGGSGSGSGGVLVPPPPSVAAAAAAALLLPSLSSLLLEAARDATDAVDRVALKVLLRASVSAEHAEAPPTHGGGATTSPLRLTVSVAAAIVDGAAKALAALALSCPAAPSAAGGVARASAVAHALDALLECCKLSASATVGGCQRRLAAEKQLVRLLVTPTLDLRRELAVAVVLSVEEDACVRHAVQAKLASHLLHRVCDMRVAALLLLTAVSEESKSSYQRLRGVVEAVGDHLRARQASQGTSLSSPAAPTCYWEYATPFLVHTLAHHPYFTSAGAAHHFIHFQRVWHLLVGELLRHGTQCAGFVVELLSKIKQADDVLAPESDACRVMCDLASRVLLECLGQRQSRAEDLRRYPGAVLLPSIFVPTSRSSPQKVLETVFLDDGVRVSANAPFRAPTANSSAGGAVAAAAGSGSRGSSRQATSRASSIARRGGAVDAEPEDADVAAAPAPPAAVAAGRQKRCRSPPVADVSIDVSPSPSVRSPTPETAERSAAAAAAGTVHKEEEEEGSCRSVPRRERTQPAIAESSCLSSTPHSDTAGGHEEACARTRAALQRRTVEEALDELFRGLTKHEIAQLRWKVVRSRLEEALRALERDQRTALTVTKTAEPSSCVTSLDADMEGLMHYAKDQLRVRYDRAPA